jgi:NAD(P) transhydrogenase subunit alpha
MRIAVPRETAPDERRVGLVPDGVAKLVKAGHSITVERGDGADAGAPDAAYEKAGASLADSFAATVAGADVVAKVQRPSPAEIASLPEGSVLIAILSPSAQRATLEALASRRITALAMELVPRITRAQSMDVLSSQATVAGYKAVLLGAAQLTRLLPMLTTAAGTLAPSRVFVLGAGVAGLQAIATARRLGAIVSAFDVRPAVREQVQSLGATFIEAEAVSSAAEGAGGYARELAEEQQLKVLEAVGKVLPTMDLVITTAQIPGKLAPRLITDAMLATMRRAPWSTARKRAATRRPAPLDGRGARVTVMALNPPAAVPLHAADVGATC